MLGTPDSVKVGQRVEYVGYTVMQFPTFTKGTIVDLDWGTSHAPITVQWDGPWQTSQHWMMELERL